MVERLLKEFKEFALKGNVVDMAVGVIIGAAFGTVIKSLVSDVIMPPIGLLVGKVDFSDLYLILKNGAPHGPYPTASAALKAGAVAIRYGTFINDTKPALFRAKWINKKLASSRMRMYTLKY